MGRDEMIEAMARATLPALWSSDPVVAHRAASPLKVDLAREGSLASAAIVLRNLEAQGLVVSQGWQPIETAPRDGTPFIAKAYVSSTKTGAKWEENHVIWCHDETGEIHSDCEQGWQVDDYSLWMPLPAPPIAAAGGV